MVVDLQRERRRLIRHLARGGAVVMEDVGGCVGLRCASAARTGREFAPEALQRLLEDGCTYKRLRYLAAPIDGRDNVFKLQLCD